MTSSLFSPLTIAAPQGDGLTLRNRAFVSPMCQYIVDAHDGVPHDWHLQHYGSLAVGGFGLVTTEATAVEPRGRISPRDIGLWNDEQQQVHARIVDFVHSQGAAIATQLSHAGGKASTYPWLPDQPGGTVPADQGGWQTVGITDQPVFPGLDAPQALDADGLKQIIDAFRDAARRADAAGYDSIQLHGAHGYLMHQALSPLTNTRTDEYGGDLPGRSRLMREIVDAVRSVWPATKPLGMRISATDWTESGLDLETAAAVMHELVADHGLNWIDVSSGGLNGGPIPMGPGYQVSLATAIKDALVDTDAVVSSVGMITDATQAETILTTDQADAVSIGRAALRNPHWAAQAAVELGVPLEDNPVADQFWRAYL